jgi:hypothetical protein
MPGVSIFEGAKMAICLSKVVIFEVIFTTFCNMCVQSWHFCDGGPHRFSGHVACIQVLVKERER